MTTLKPAERPAEPSAVPAEGWRQHALADKAYKALRVSAAVPAEGSGHPQPFVECLWPVGDDGCVRPIGHDGHCSTTRRPVLSLDTPEGDTDANP